MVTVINAVYGITLVYSMLLKRYKISRLKALLRVIDDYVSLIVWVVDRKDKNGGYFKFLSLSEYLNNIYSDLSNLVLGYYDAYTFEDSHFLTYEEVFRE